MTKPIRAKKSESHITAKKVDDGVTVDINCNGEELIALFCSIVESVKKETNSHVVLSMIMAVLKTNGGERS